MCVKADETRKKKVKLPEWSDVEGSITTDGDARPAQMELLGTMDAVFASATECDGSAQLATIDRPATDTNVRPEILERWTNERDGHDDADGDECWGGVQLVLSDEPESVCRVLGILVPDVHIQTCDATLDLGQTFAFQKSAWDDVKETKSCPPAVAIALDLTRCSSAPVHDENAETSSAGDGGDGGGGEWSGAETRPPSRALKQVWRTLEDVCKIGRFIQMRVAVAVTSTEAHAFALHMPHL